VRFFVRRFTCDQTSTRHRLEVLDELADDAGHPGGLGVEGGRDPVAEHQQPNRLDARRGGMVVVTVENGAGLGLPGSG
jgi:hypothetical protein